MRSRGKQKGEHDMTVGRRGVELAKTGTWFDIHHHRGKVDCSFTLGISFISLMLLVNLSPQRKTRLCPKQMASLPDTDAILSLLEKGS